MPRKVRLWVAMFFDSDYRPHVFLSSPLNLFSTTPGTKSRIYYIRNAPYMHEISLLFQNLGNHEFKFK